MSFNYLKFVFNTLFMTQKYALPMSVLKRIKKKTHFFLGFILMTQIY